MDRKEEQQSFCLKYIKLKGDHCSLKTKKLETATESISAVIATNLFIILYYISIALVEVNVCSITLLRCHIYKYIYIITFTSTIFVYLQCCLDFLTPGNF